MTVTSRKYFTDWFVANGALKDWGFDFTILSQDDVVVLVRDGTDDSSIVEYTTDLAFYPSADFSSGTVRYPVVAAALPAGKQVRILRRVAYFQLEKIGKEGKFLPQTHEKAFDKLTIQTQQVDNNLELAVKVQLGSTPLTILSGLAEDKALIRQGDFLVGGPTVSEISNAQTYAQQAAASATSANTSKNTATTKASEASASATLAQKFATELVDVPVLPGLFSAFHWAQKAYDVVAAGIIDLSVTTAKIANGAVTQAKLAADVVSGWSAKSSMADADQFLIGDSAASNVAKKLTLANLVTSIFASTRAIANAIFLTATLKFRNATGADLTFNTTALTGNRVVTWPNAAVDIGALSGPPDLTLTSVSGSRVLGTVYQNTGSTCRVVTVDVANNSMVVNIGPTTGVAVRIYNDASSYSAQFIVPPGWYYKAVGTTLNSWYEGQLA